VGDDTRFPCRGRGTVGRLPARRVSPVSTLEYRRQLLTKYQRTGDGRVRDELVATYMPLVRSIAARFQGRGVPMEDLIQVACIGLVVAIDRYDARQGVAFETYLWPTIVGEIKRYFRDCAWHVKVPRRRQKLAAEIREVEERLAGQTGRYPSLTEIARALGVADEEIAAALEVNYAYAPTSLEQRLSSAQNPESLRPNRERGKRDRNLDAVELRTALLQALEHLEERKRQILGRRYLVGETQRQVAQDLGLSQMQVSRLERQALRQLRDLLGG
jgi:RNA polymerase sigma-B factor